MPAMISRLQTKNGEIYALSQNWPEAEVLPLVDGNPNPNQLKVGSIFLLPGEEDPVYTFTTSTRDDGEEEEEEELAGTVSQPARYEIWCITDRILSLLMAQLRRQPVPQEELHYLYEGGAGLIRRVIHLDAVACVDEDWPAPSAFEKLIERFTELNRGAAAEEKEKQSAQAPSNGTAASPG